MLPAPKNVNPEQPWENWAGTDEGSDATALREEEQNHVFITACVSIRAARVCCFYRVHPGTETDLCFSGPPTPSQFLPHHFGSFQLEEEISILTFSQAKVAARCRFSSTRTLLERLLLLMTASLCLQKYKQLSILSSQYTQDSGCQRWLLLAAGQAGTVLLLAYKAPVRFSKKCVTWA